MTLTLTPPPSKVHNLIFGRTWIDSPGDMVMENLTTGEKVILYFQPCGWFGYAVFDISPVLLCFYAGHSICEDDPQYLGLVVAGRL